MWWFIAIVYLIQAAGMSRELTIRGKDVNPEVHANVSQMIRYGGYPSEEYEVLTDDGYYLVVNRIPGGKNHPVVRVPKPVVLLQHGILADASNWIMNMPNNSLGFILADAGYDVWFGNNRGTRACNRHQYLSIDQDEFWNFSFHEMAMYDLPAMVNFILNKTGQKDLYYIGHSQGCTIGFIAFSAIPELSQKIKMFFALAPEISVKHSSSPAVKLLASLPESKIKKVFGTQAFPVIPRKVKDFVTKLCSYLVMQKSCAYVLLSAGGFNAAHLNMSRVDVYLDHYPDRTSIKSLLHWKQMRTSGLFRQFDYGSENQDKYNQPYPPSYDIEEMTVPTAVWSGGEDLVADPEDMKLLLPRITNLVYHGHVADWNHGTFVFGISAANPLYYKIATLVQKSLETNPFSTADFI